MVSSGWTLSMIHALIVAMTIMCYFGLTPMMTLLKATFWNPISSVLLHGDLLSLTFLASCSTVVFSLLNFICEYSQSPEPAAADEASQVDKDKQSRTQEGTKRLPAYYAALEKIKWYSAAYEALRELLNRRAAELRDKERIIQNQATEVARFDHRAEAAKLSLKNKSDYADGLIKQLEINTITIEDRDSTIREQAQHIMNSEWDLNAMANQMDEKDEQIWDITGQNTAAQEEIAKLKAAVKNEFTESDYCAALHTIDRRDQDIVELQAQLKQYRDAHESKYTAAYQSDCEAHRHSIELQHSLLQKSRQDRDELEKQVNSLKVQNFYELSKTRANLDDLTNAYNFIEKDRAALKIKLKDARDLLKTHEGARDISNAERDRLEATLTQVVEQGLEVTRAYKKSENALAEIQQDLFQTRVKLQIVEHAFQLAGISCDVWTLQEASPLATQLGDLKTSPSEQEAQLADSCAQLSASNEQHQTEIREQKSQIRTLKTTLADKRAELHSQHQTYYRAHCKNTHALAAAKRDFADLQSRFAALEARSVACDKESAGLRASNAEGQQERTKLAAELSGLAKRHDDARGVLARCLRSNVRLRKIVGEKEEGAAGLDERVKELEGVVERSQSAGENCREEIGMLIKVVGDREGEIAELEKRLEFEGGEFVEVEKGDVEGMDEEADEGEEEEAVFVPYDREEGGEVEEEEIEFIMEALEVDEDGDRVEAENGKAAW